MNTKDCKTKNANCENCYTKKLEKAYKRILQAKGKSIRQCKRGEVFSKNKVQD